MGSQIDLIRALAAEFMATLIFVYFSTMSVMGPSGDVTHSLVEVALAHGIVIMVLVYITASVSGGHINPSVTIGVLIAGGTTWAAAILYVTSQLAGGLLGAALTLGSVSIESYKNGSGGATMVSEGVNVAQALGLEFSLTFFLVMTVIMTAVDDKGKSTTAPIAIGLAVTACALCGGSYTGASMNIARSFGPVLMLSTVEGGSAFVDHWVYWLATPLGGMAAGLVYRLVMASDEQRLPLLQSKKEDATDA